MARVFGEFIDVVTATAEAKDQPVFTKATIEGWLAEIERWATGAMCAPESPSDIYVVTEIIRAKMNE